MKADISILDLTNVWLEPFDIRALGLEMKMLELRIFLGNFESVDITRIDHCRGCCPDDM